MFGFFHRKTAAPPETQNTKQADSLTQSQPVAPKEITMSIATDVTSIFSKALKFFSVVASDTAKVDATWQKLAPATKAAVLATFHDAISTATGVSGVAADLSTGNFTGAVTLSVATVGMVKNVVADGKDDLTALENIVTAVKADV